MSYATLKLTMSVLAHTEAVTGRFYQFLRR